MELTLLVLLWVVCGLGSAWLGKESGRPPGTWFFAGFLLGPLGLAWAAFLQPVGTTHLSRHL